jgi:hypothetical protein
MTRASVPLGSSPAFSILAIVPIDAKSPSTRGTSTMRRPGLLGRGAGPLRLVGFEGDRHDHLGEHDALRELATGGAARRASRHQSRDDDWSLRNAEVSVSDIVDVGPFSGNTTPTAGSGDLDSRPGASGLGLAS